MDTLLSLSPFARYADPALLALRIGVSAFLGLITGLLTRWAGVLCAFNFIVALVMVDHFSGVRGAFPALCLVLIGVYLATRGAGAFSADAKRATKEVSP